MNKKSTNITSRAKKSSTVSARKASTVSKKRSTSSSKTQQVASISDILYVLPLGNGWVVKSRKASKFTVITDSKREAISIARNMARTKKSRLVVHGKDGLVELKESYLA